MIIVEGPDGAGKSTLVKELKEQFPELEEGKRGVDDRDKLWEVTRPDTYRALAECLTTPNPHIWDRLFWSEFAYWSVTGRECQFTVNDELVIPQVIKALRAPVIWCLPPITTVEDNVDNSKQMFGVAGNVTKIYEKYVQMRNQEMLMPHGINLMTYDYTSDDLGTDRSIIFGRVQAYLEHRNVP